MFSSGVRRGERGRSGGGSLGRFNRLDFCQVHGEVELDLNRLYISSGMVEAIYVHLQLPQIANDTAPALLEREMHMIARRCSDVIP